jgi:hypothetical protein
MVSSASAAPRHGSSAEPDRMLEIYASAQAAAHTSTEVARGIADFAAFMSTGPRKTKER